MCVVCLPQGACCSLQNCTVWYAKQVLSRRTVFWQCTTLWTVCKLLDYQCLTFPFQWKGFCLAREHNSILYIWFCLRMGRVGGRGRSVVSGVFRMHVVCIHLVVPANGVLLPAMFETGCCVTLTGWPVFATANKWLEALVHLLCFVFVWNKGQNRTCHLPMNVVCDGLMTPSSCHLHFISLSSRW